MTFLSLPLHSLQYAEIVVRSMDPDVDFSNLSFSVRPTCPPSSPLTNVDNVDVQVRAVCDARGSYLSICLGRPSGEPSSLSAPAIESSPSPPWSIGSDGSSDGNEALLGEFLQSARRTDEFLDALHGGKAAWGNDANGFSGASGSPSASLSSPYGFGGYFSGSFDGLPSPPLTASSSSAGYSDPEGSPFAYGCTLDDEIPISGSSEAVKRARSVAKMIPVSRKKPALKCHYPGCDAHFSRQHDRMRHEVNKHGHKCEFTCDTCRRFFSNASTLERHRCTGVPPAMAA
ncbi:uncharacterized protein SCHCODRAFT_02532312 [Schizophyllum commune H4-8]|uniref:Expressed protein n=1 Tax=Schizophyllum commune (strain H4-8 / FGSC 9210) TaxID=578458 RepID=D8PZL7_SCHCM|nr:uncharacterized protein SCHCODRAFT_02532312 [Schizophyllum commune H4-8]KAI5896429.1 hypothetical protein SCHCODRAFT_02532312 [Schizophyllum commune H4-8]